MEPQPQPAHEESIKSLAIPPHIQAQVERLTRGTQSIVPAQGLAEKLLRSEQTGRPLRIKLGLDPTAPDIHLGFAVVLRKLRQFQDMGHQVILIIGDYTTLIGDPSGRSATRPLLSSDEIAANAGTYVDQLARVLDRDKTIVHFNSEWLGKLTFADIIRLTSTMTVAKVLSREDFANRLAQHQPLALHELLYPLAQAYDSVAIEADVEMGGQDQTFNILAGRDLQKEHGQEPQVALFMPLLVGLDGVKKMSKSLGNYVGITESPDQMYGKLMSLSDPMMRDYFILCTDVPLNEVDHLLQQSSAGVVNPKDVASTRRAPNELALSTMRRGDVARGFADSDVVLDQVYETAAQYHAYLEPSVALAAVDGRGKVTVWSSTQSVFRTQANVHESLGIPMAKIRAISPRVGGGFGAKSEATVQPIAVALAMKTGRPVRVVLGRDEDMIAMRSRHPARIRIRTGAKRDGTLVARALEAWFDGGAYADDSAAVMNFALFFGTGPYRFDHVELVGHAVYTNKLRAGAFRGFGNPQITFAGESQIDDLALELGMDPLDLRLKNIVGIGDRWIGGQTITTIGLETCIEKVATASRWRERAGKTSGETAARKGMRRGLGLALTAHISGFLSTSAVVRLSGDGSVALNTGAVDLGQGCDTALAQMCAAGLGLSVEDVNVVAPDTDASPYNSGTNASRVTYMVGRAVGQATEVVRQKMFKLAADMLECSEADLELRPGGVIGVEGTDRAVTFAEIAGKSIWFADGGGPVIGTGSVMHNEPLDPKHTTLTGFVSFDNVGAFSFGAQVVEVEIDEATGKVDVVEAWCAHDVGRAINPGAVEGQIQGGFVQGLGYALTEEMVWDGGRLANPTFMDYKIPSSRDVPYDIHVIIVEVPDPLHPFGAKGIGEPPLIGAAAAIPNAIAAAAGVRVRRLPVTPERMLRALWFGTDGVDA